MTKSKVKCPRCFSDDLYKFGKDKYGNQKYQCKRCYRQFAPETLNIRSTRKRKYPSCPKCGKASFLHHEHKYYYNFKCCYKYCNHSFFVPKNKAINPPSHKISLPGKIDFKKMRYSPYIILLALYTYFLHGSTTRKVAQYLYDVHNIKVSHVTIASWTRKFAPLFMLKSKEFLPNNLNHSDEWHIDETVVKIHGKKYYLWAVIDSETRFVLSFHLSPYRSSASAFELLSDAKKHFGHPGAIVSDRFHAYKTPVKVLFPDCKHIRVDSFKDDISNNLIESFFGTFKDWYNGRKGFKSFTSAKQLICVFIFFYNYVRPHSMLNNLTPAQVAGCNYSDKHRRSWLIAA